MVYKIFLYAYVSMLLFSCISHAYKCFRERNKDGFIEGAVMMCFFLVALYGIHSYPAE